MKRKNDHASKIQSFWKGKRIRNLLKLFIKIKNFISILNKVMKNKLKGILQDIKIKISKKQYNNYKQKKIVTKRIKIKTSKLKSKVAQKIPSNKFLENAKFQIDKNRYEDLIDKEKNYNSLFKEYEELIKKYSELKYKKTIINTHKTSRPFKLLGPPSGLTLPKNKINIFKNVPNDIRKFLYQEKNSLELGKKILYSNSPINKINNNNQNNILVYSNSNENITNAATNDTNDKYEENQNRRKRVFILKKNKKIKNLKFDFELKKSRNQLFINSSSRNNTLSDDRATRDSSKKQLNNLTPDKEKETLLIERNADNFTIFSNFENSERNKIKLNKKGITLIASNKFKIKRKFNINTNHSKISKSCPIHNLFKENNNYINNLFLLPLNNEKYNENIKIIYKEKINNNNIKNKNIENVNATSHKFEINKLLPQNENIINIIQKKKYIKKNGDKLMLKPTKKKLNNIISNNNILIEINDEEESNNKTICNCKRNKYDIFFIKSIFDLKDKLIYLNKKKYGKIFLNNLIKNSIITHLKNIDKIINKKIILNAFNKYKKIYIYEKILDNTNNNIKNCKNLIITKATNDCIINKKDRKDYIVNKVITNLNIKSNKFDNEKNIANKCNEFYDKLENKKIMPDMSIAITKVVENLIPEKCVSEFSIKGISNNLLEDGIDKMKMHIKLDKFENKKCIITKTNNIIFNNNKIKLNELIISKEINNLYIKNNTNNKYKNLLITKSINEYTIKGVIKKENIIYNKTNYIRPIIKKQNNLFIIKKTNNLAIKNDINFIIKNENVLENKKEKNKFNKELIITNEVNKFNIINRKPKNYIISKTIKNFSIEGIFTPEKAQKNTIDIKNNIYINNISNIKSKNNLIKILDNQKLIITKENQIFINNQNFLNKFDILNNDNEKLKKDLKNNNSIVKKEKDEINLLSNNDEKKNYYKISKRKNN